ncbi:MAG: hypothetical protein HY078_12775 [Elusimicrobia bacterium]|nr:hypothetical protein [Elusimicrobiota bacterium]
MGPLKASLVAAFAAIALAGFARADEGSPAPTPEDPLSTNEMCLIPSYAPREGMGPAAFVRKMHDGRLAGGLANVSYRDGKPIRFQRNRIIDQVDLKRSTRDEAIVYEGTGFYLVMRRRGESVTGDIDARLLGDQLADSIKTVLPFDDCRLF